MTGSKVYILRLRNGSRHVNELESSLTSVSSHRYKFILHIDRIQTHRFWSKKVTNRFYKRLLVLLDWNKLRMAQIFDSLITIKAN
jgi:hypothetical protein